jgi:hypothetical protein
MNVCHIKSLISDKKISYVIGDVVVLFRRKGKKGYPRKIEDDVEYTILDLIDDNLIIRKHSTDGHGWAQPIKIHKSYMISKGDLRDVKINSILS